MRLKILLVVFGCSICTAFSQELVKDKTASSISFKIKNFGFNVAGNFNEFVTDSNFNTNNVEEIFFNVKIEVKSIFTDSEARDKHLLNSDYFDVDTYPNIVFESNSIKKISASKYELEGVITMKGIQKRIETVLDVSSSKTSVTILASFSLNRKDFGIGGNSLVLAKEVNIKMKYVGVKN
jgi:polyisoprenoid-binding protein YceI